MTKISLELELKQLAQAILDLPKNERQQLLSLLATLEEEQDPESIEARKEAEEDMREGRVFTFEEVFGDRSFSPGTLTPPLSHQGRGR